MPRKKSKTPAHTGRTAKGHTRDVTVDRIGTRLIMVGGTAFNEVEGLWKKVGADRYARTIDDAVEISNEFFRNQVN